MWVSMIITVRGILNLTSGPISVENTGDTDVNAILPLEAVSESFSYTLPFIITGPRTDGVDVTPTAYDE